ncbi:hypothetical protein LEP1GSC062_0561 [Leptospira alexanderi serovar Manhao 3 str. L 60]|uniref:Uncharacterized protein n=1 Tax=Leptospira alexanderi serovar Manhao 3 str. L 60 TaxID=1049759 RepID=V6I9K6_9LEPT|nr:hypothetical protein LEP1GSC062_0561 [Leptospira alexanderi serovar Manhao 3 str. L 60]
MKIAVSNFSPDRNPAVRTFNGLDSSIDEFFELVYQINRLRRLLYMISSIV